MYVRGARALLIGLAAHKGLQIQLSRHTESRTANLNSISFELIQMNWIEIKKNHNTMFQSANNAVTQILNLFFSDCYATYEETQKGL